ncbi:hypothetical protein [Kineosporia sp. NBRC 101731]|uniref:hypothetical protein n=1 Tax=Kineosporia sp. NBRC 101731 TaxID=3032199 RepID=UPI0024A3BBB7|nr:hypothetical protein [Kineosporia sp. NBRC 101731]GLY29103.1 hypothetical protein Kisp02_24680 [Kineosporia sp. NBRC 101731]
MTESSKHQPLRYRAEASEPGVLPGSPPSAGTLYAALYGDLSPHSLEEPRNDPYALFHDRSRAMGWLDDRSGSADLLQAPGLWAMNDAGSRNDDAPAGSDQITWFQVEASTVPSDRPLPTQPFLACAEAATGRLGTLRLTKVRIELPTQALTTSPRASSTPIPSLSVADYFLDGDPTTRAEVRVSVSSADGEGNRSSLNRLGEFLAGLDQKVFVVDGFVPPTPEPLTDPTDNFFWNAPDAHGAVITGQLVEWTGETIGWLAGALADCFVHLGGTSPILVTVARV